MLRFLFSANFILRETKYLVRTVSEIQRSATGTKRIERGEMRGIDCTA